MKNSSEKQKPIGAWSAMRAILWSFYGVRSKGEYEADISRLSMKQLIIAGLIGAVLFVLALVVLVSYVTH
ncbi:MAG TPA: DUF2970 domain-containing protein [Gallionellaceae bacterium]|nr:DUF2970 domain-containing protein [Gallionellaceae bacterium]